MKAHKGHRWAPRIFGCRMQVMSFASARALPRYGPIVVDSFLATVEQRDEKQPSQPIQSAVWYVQVLLQSCLMELSNSTTESVTVRWGNGTTTDFHYFWLRDNCRCPDCYHT